MQNLRPDRGLCLLGELAFKSAADFGDHPAFRIWRDEAYYTVSFARFAAQVKAIANWLVGHGLKPGDRAGVLGENCPEWGAAYLGILAAGGVVVPVDSLMPPSGVRHVLVDSEARFLFSTYKFLRDLSEHVPAPSVEIKINLSAKPHNDTIDLQQVLDETSQVESILPQRSLSDLAALLYTSGTTGHSKGVMLSHRNIISNVAAASRWLPLGLGDTFLSVLPIHHAFEGTAGFLLPLYCGCSVTYARSLKSTDLINDIRDTNVTLMMGVPLLYEKLHAGILRGVKKKGQVPEMLFRSLHKVVGVGNAIGVEMGERLFRDMRQKAGLGSVKYFISGGGPLDPVTGEFFDRLGIKMLQGYGLTETSPVTHINPPDRIKMATVGPTLAGVECRIAKPNAAGVGEIEIKGPNVFMGYYRNEEATAEAFSEDGWFKTGDLGSIDAEGYLQIKGRKKNLIVTGGGKNVYPEEIETLLNHQRFIAESLVLGVARESGYGEEVGAMIFPDFEQIDLHFEETQNPAKATPEDVRKLIQKEIETASAELAEYKRVKKFKIVEEEFQKTSTRKIKRFLYRGEMVGM